MNLDNFELIRKIKGLTQVEATEILMVSKISYLRCVVRKENRLKKQHTLNEARTIAKILDVNVNALYDHNLIDKINQLLKGTP